MIFHKTHTWVTDKSPYTGHPKTQTRRLVGLDDHYDGALTSVITKRRVKWMVGRSYAIQPGRGKHATGRFELVSIRREPLQAISEADAQAEGCRDVAHYAELWNEIHTKRGERWEDNPDVWVLETNLIRSNR